ncbi:sensor domain-containing protein [Geodermatophilus sp. SYSU D00758]
MTADTAVLPTVPAHPAPAAARPRRLRQLLVDSGYTLAAFPLAVAALTVVVTGLAAGAGLAVVWIGVAVLAATLGAARGLAEVERAWLPAVLGRALPRPVYRPVPAGGLARLTAPLRDRRYWLDALYALVRFPVAVLGFAVTVTFWAGALGGLTYGAWDWALPHRAGDEDLLQMLGLSTGAGARIALYTGLGLVFALLLPVAVRAVATLQARLGEALLAGRPGAR